MDVTWTQDAELLLELHAATAGQERRPPWAWAALTTDERAALTRLIDRWVHSHNHVYAVVAEQVIPPCWPAHPWLAAELAVQVWLWYQVHLDSRATATTAADYYQRLLPGFHDRVDRMLGASPGECREGMHPASWRQDADDVLGSPRRSWRPRRSVDEDHRCDAATLGFGFVDSGMQE